ncbi:hypothetical protein Tco_1195794, partial [Tanacetum coccineum]
TPLSIGITKIKNDDDVDAFVNVGYQNKWVVNLYVVNNVYDELDIRYQGETMAVDEGNESSDAYCSSDEEDLSFVDFHTEVDDCGYRDLHHLISLTKSSVILHQLEEFQSARFIFNLVQSNILSAVTYIRHNPSQAWNATEPVLGMRYEHPEQLKLCRCARYNTIKREKELFSTKSDDKEQKQGRKKSFKVNKVTTRSRAKTSEDASKSPQTTCKSSMKAGNSGEGCSKSPK